MEITVIHGQNHKGSTYHITEKLINAVADDDTITHEYFMSRNAIEYCVGCFNCITKGEHYCPQYEKVNRIVSAMETSDLIIVASPTYCMEMTGQLKTLFDHLAYMWLAHRPNEKMFKKTGIVISTAAGAGAKRVTKSLKNQLFYLGIPKTYELHFNVNALSFEGVSAKKITKIDTKIKKVSRKVQQKQMVGIKLRFIYGLMRMNQKSNDWNPVDRIYWEEKGWLEKERPWKG